MLTRTCYGIYQDYNNNAALVKDSAGKDWVVIGKGIGFGLKKGMPVDESKIERRFLAQEEIDQDEPWLKCKKKLLYRV